MNKKRRKLRLRKQVIIAMPIFLLLVVVSIGLLISRGCQLSTEVQKTNVLSSKSNYGKSEISLSDLDYIKELENNIEKRKKDNTIVYYAGLFKLKEEETLRIVHEYTNNYDDEAYNVHNVIGPSNIVSSVGSFKSFEAGVVYFIRDVYRYPEKYGSSIDAIRTSIEPTPKAISSDGNYYMNNGMTFEQYLKKICDLYDMDERLVLAISYHEAGVKSSTLFQTKNNIGGHKGLNGWMSFTTLEAGIISHVLSVRSIAARSNVDISEILPEEVYTLSAIYVNGNLSNQAPVWAEKVLYFINLIETEDSFK